MNSSALVPLKLLSPFLLSLRSLKSSHRTIMSAVTATPQTTLDALFPAPPNKHSLFPSVPGQLPGQTKESTDALLRLLKENHDRWHIFFNDKGFHKCVCFPLIINKNSADCLFFMRAVMSHTTCMRFTPSELQQRSSKLHITRAQSTRGPPSIRPRRSRKQIGKITSMTRSKLRTLIGCLLLFKNKYLLTMAQILSRIFEVLHEVCPRDRKCGDIGKIRLRIGSKLGR